MCLYIIILFRSSILQITITHPINIIYIFLMENITRNPQGDSNDCYQIPYI